MIENPTPSKRVFKRIIRICKEYGEEFFSQAAKIARGSGLFCKLACFHQSIAWAPDTHFWPKVNKIPGGCWLWTAGLTQKGYGQCSLRAPDKRAHRTSWLLTRGPIPDGLCVLHTCDVRTCVKPEHLFLGTQLDNLRDCASKRRNTHGIKHFQAKFTEAQILEIRDDYRHGVRVGELAKKHAVGHRTIGAIVHRRNWKHLP